MFINISNHPIMNWSKDQLDSAAKYGEVVDYPFPVVPALSDEEDIHKMAEKVMSDVSIHKDAVLLIQGEFTLTYRLVMMAKALGMIAVAACSERVTEETVNDDGSITKVSKYKFIRFREY